MLDPERSGARRASRSSTRPWSPSTAEELSPIVTGIVYCGVDPRVPGGLRGAAGARVDAGARGLVGGRSRTMVAFTGRCLVHRAEILQLDGAVAGRARGGAPRGRALPRDARTRPRASRAIARESSSGCRASSPAAETAYRAGEHARLGAAAGPRAAAARAGAHRCLRSAAIRAGGSGDYAALLERAVCFRRYVEIMLAAGERRGRVARACTSSRQLVGRLRERDAGRDGRAGAGRGPARGAASAPTALVVASRGRATRWQALEAPVRDRPDARARRRGLPRCSATTRRPSSSSRRRASVFDAPRREAGPRRDSRPERRRMRTGCRAASSRCSGSSRPASTQPRDRVDARHQRAHRRAAPPEHLREARRLVARGGNRVRLRARPRLTLQRVVGIDHARYARKLVNPRDVARDRLPSYRRAKRAEEDEMASSGERVRDRHHRRRSGRPLDGVPPGAGSAMKCLILEADDRVGDVWRRRFDSLRLFTPAKYDGLDGLGNADQGLQLAHQGRGRRLSGGLRDALRASGPHRDRGGRSFQAGQGLRHHGGPRGADGRQRRRRVGPVAASPRRPSSAGRARPRHRAACTPTTTGTRRSCSRGRSSWSEPATPGADIALAFGHPCDDPFRADPMARCRSRPRRPGVPERPAGDAGSSRPHVLTEKTPIGRKMQVEVRKGGGPLLRVPKRPTCGPQG